MFPRCGCIVAYTAAEHVSVTAQLAELNLQAREDTIMIEARTIGLHVSPESHVGGPLAHGRQVGLRHRATR